MKYIYPDISEVIDTDNIKINTIIIENPVLFKNIIEDIYFQLHGLDGKSVVSDKNTPIDFSKNVEMINQFIPFDINKKSLLTKIANNIEKQAVSPEYYEESMEIMTIIEKYFLNLTDKMNGNIIFSKMNISSLIKGIGIEIEEDYQSLSEKILDYMELVREYDKEKLFIFVNLRSYIDDTEVYNFFDTLIRKLYHVVFIDNKEYKLLSNEQRIVIDKDLCEILIS